MADEHWQTAQTIKNARDNQFATGLIDVLSNPNLIQPTNSTFTAVTNSGEIVDSASATKILSVDDYTATFSSIAQMYWGNKDLLHRINPNSQTLIDDTDFPHQVAPGAGAHSAHTTFLLDDLALYKINNSQRLFYFYRDNTDGDAGTFDLNTTFTADETAWSSASGGAVLNNDWPIVAEVADNGFMYVGNGNALYKFDGTAAGGANGTVTTPIDLESIWTIVDLKDYKGKMLVLAKKGTTTSNEIREFGMYIWDRTTTSLSFDDIILFDGVFAISQIFLFKNVPCIFTLERTGNNSTISFRIFDGYGFNIKRTLFSPSADYELPNLKKVATQYANTLVFMGDLGNVFCLEDPLGEARLHKVASLGLTASDDVIGGLHSATVGGYFYFPHQVSGGTTTMKYWAFGATTGTGAGNFYSKVYELPKLSRIKSITAYYQPLTSTADKNVTINLYKNMSTTAALASNLSINYTTDGARGWMYFPVDIENVSTIQMLLTYPSGETVTNSLKFSRFEIEYDPTTKVK